MEYTQAIAIARKWTPINATGEKYYALRWLALNDLTAAMLADYHAWRMLCDEIDLLLAQGPMYISPESADELLDLRNFASVMDKFEHAVKA